MHIHFIGIGGIGVSSLAQYFLEKGNRISGSDLTASEITDFLKSKGIEIIIAPKSKKQKYIGSSFIKQSDLVIYSPAVSKNHPGLRMARRLGIPCLSYPEALGELTKKYFTIAVSGTHGKSTTTAMAGLLLARAGLDPTVIVGTKLKEFDNSNCRIGRSKFLVIEADEHMGSFLNYWPKIIVLTSIEKDHLDYYKNLANILKTFKKYISHLPAQGLLIANKDDKNIQKILKSNRIKNSKSYINKSKKNVIFYSLRQKESVRLRKILTIPGEHNVSNALAALTLARALNISDNVSFRALSLYQGSWRRFEEKKVKIGDLKLKIISDYAHHPTEIKATLKAVREKYPKKEIWCLFQPHQYQRTYYLFKDFVRVFQKAPIDKLIITDVYNVAGREQKQIKKKVGSEKLVRAIKKNISSKKTGNVIYLSGFPQIVSYLRENLKGGEVLIIMGAGDIYKIEELLLDRKQK